MSTFAQLWNAPAVQIETDAEEAAIILDAQAGDEAATMRLFNAYIPALRSVVNHYSSLPEEDARQSALLGFLEVIRDHDATRSPRLAGRLRARLHDALAEAASDAAGGFTVPPRTLRRFFGILSRAGGDVASALAIAPDYEMSEETFLAVLAAVRADESLDAAIEAGGGAEALTLVAEVHSPREIADADDRMLCDIAFRAVNDFEREVCGLAYGFTDYDPIPDAEIGHRLGGFGRVRVLRTRQRALGKMRVAVGA